MSDDAIKEKIRIARDAVKDEEEPFKTEGFKVILASLMEGTNMGHISKQRTGSKHKSNKKQNRSITTPVIFEQKKELDELAKKCGISKDELSEVITIRNNIVQIIKRPSIQEKQKHVLFSLCILTAYKVLYEIEWLSSITLRKSLDESGVGDLTHSSEGISETPLIVDRGSKKAKEYKITGKGMDKAFSIIKKLSGDESIVEN